MQKSILGSTEGQLTKKEARRIYKNALQRGDLTPKPCQKCHTTENIHGHHEDYQKPLEVVWLCRRHHFLLHSLRAWEVRMEKRRQLEMQVKEVREVSDAVQP